MITELRDKATICYSRLTHGKIIEKTNYRYDKLYSHSVFIFSSKSIEAQATPFQTILMSDFIFKKCSKNVRDYIFLHELGHVKLNYFWQLLFYITVIPSFLLLFASILAIPFAFLSFLIYGFSISFVAFVFIDFVLFSFIVLILNWAMEGYAEIFAIKIIGVKKYKQCMEEMKKHSKKKNIFNWYFYRIRYPPEKILFWIYKRSIS